MIKCDEGTPVFNPQTEEERQAYEHFLDVYDGDQVRAYKKFALLYRTDYNKYLKDRIGTKTVEGFTPTQQDQILGMIKFLAIRYMNHPNIVQDGKPKLGRLKTLVGNIIDKNLRSKFEGDAWRQGEFDKIVENYDTFWSMTHQSLKQLGLETDDNGNIVQSAGLDADIDHWNDQARLMRDPKATSSIKVKFALSLIPKVEWDRAEDGRIRKDDQGRKKRKKTETYLGSNRYASMDTIYDTLGEILSDYLPPEDAPDKYKAYLDHLETVASGNAQMMEVLSHLRSIDDKTFQSDFVNSLGKTYTTQSMIMFKPVTKKVQGKTVVNGYSLMVLDSNRTNQKNTIKEGWYENQKTLPIVSQDKEGDLRFNRSEIRSIKEEYITKMENHLENGTIFDEDALNIVRDTLAKLGITVPIDALEEISQNPKKIGKVGTWSYHVKPNNGGLNNTKQKKGLLGYIFEVFEKDEGEASEQDLSEYGKLGLNNPIYGRDSQGIVDRLAKFTANHTPRVYSPSFMNTQNNQIYALQDHTSLTREIARLRQNPEEYIETEGAFHRESKILKAMRDNSGNIRNILNVDYLDGLKEYRRSKGSEHQSMSTAEKELTRVALFQNAQKNGRSVFLSPTLSDKGRDYIITLPKIQDIYGMEGQDPTWVDEKISSIDENGTLDLSASGKEAQVMYDLARGEIERIKEIQSELQDPEGLRYDTHPLGRDYMEQGQFFYYFPELNPENLTDEEVDKLWVPEDVKGVQYYRLKDPSKNDAVRKFIQEKLVQTLQSSVDQTVQRWKDLGLADGEMSTWLLDKGYLNSIPYQKNDSNRKLTYAALDYQLSNRFFLSNMAQILSGDPAQHIKNESKRDQDQNPFTRDSRVETTNQTIINIQKRYANQIAPSITGNWGAVGGNNEVTMVTLADRMVESYEYEQYKDILGENLAEFFRRIESTDAQEYTTMREHMRMAFSHGKVSEDLYNKVIDIIDEAGPGGYYNLKKKLTEKEYNNLFLMPHKPVYVGKKYYPNIDSTVWMYRKTSSFPLMPEMTKGTPLDNLRKAMENKGVDRAGFQSADKVGAYNPVDPFDGSDRNKFLSQEDIENLFINQDDVSDSSNDYTVNDLSVQTRNRNDLGLQFEIPYKKKGIKTVSQLNKMRTLGIKNIDGFTVEQEVKNEDGETVTKEVEVSGSEVERIAQDYRTQLFKASQNELLDDLNVTTKEEDGETQLIFNDLSSIQDVLIEEAEARDWSPAAIDALELDDKGKFTIPLSFTPNASDIESLLVSLINSRVIEQEMYGSSYVQTSSTGWEGLTPNNSDVILTRSYNPETGPRHIHKDESGEVQPAQIMIPWDFKDSDGNLLDPDDFTDDEGYIDNDKLDPSIREFIAARIPFQGHSSGMPVEVVGYLPSTVKKLMVVTDETVAQMGSDFDVDKLYTYENKYTLETSVKGKEEKGKVDEIDLTSENRELIKRLRSSKEGDQNFSESDKIKKRYKDLFWEIYTHPEVMSKVIQPLDMPYLGNEAKEISEDRMEGELQPYDALNPHKQVDDHNNQQAGKALIGIFSNIAVFNAMLEFYKLPMSYIDRKNGRIQRSIRYETEDGEAKLTQVGGKNPRVKMDEENTGTISDVIMMFQNGAVDNAKELILDKLNATTNTASVIGSTIMLNNGSNGLPLQQLTRFFSQSIIKELDNRVRQQQSQLNNEFISGDTQENVIEELIEELTNEHNLNPESINEPVITSTEYKSSKIPKTSDLTKHLTDTYENALNNKDIARFQLKVLKAYDDLYTVSRGLDGVQTVVNFGDRKGPGKSILEAMRKTKELRNLNKNAVFDNGRSVLQNTEWGQAAQSSFVLATNLFATKRNDLLKYGSDLFQDILHELDQYTDRGIDSEKAHEVFRELRSFVFSEATLFENIEGERLRLTRGDNNLAQRVMDAQDSWGSDHFFLQRLRPKLPESKGDPARVLFSADKGERLDEIRIIHSLSELLTSEDAEKRALGEDLVAYSYIVSGGVQTPTSFTQYIPIGYLLEIGLKETVENFDFNNRTSIINRFRDQFFQHNPKEARTLSDNEIKTIPNKAEVKPDLEKHSFLFRRQGNELFPIPYFSYYDQDKGKWRLYKSKGHTFYEIDTLGKANSKGFGTVEYNSNKDKLIKSTEISQNETRLNYNPFIQGEPDVVDTIPSEDNLPTLVSNRSEISSELFFDSVSDNIENRYVQELVNFMRSVDRDFKVAIYPQSAMDRMFGKNTEARYNPDKNKDTLIISEALVSEGQEYIARTVAHEWIHKNTVHREDYNEEQRRLYKKLSGIMKKALEVNPPSQDLRNRMSSVVTDDNGDPVLDDNGNKVTEITVEEFMAYGVATKQGQEWLANTDISGKTALDTVTDLLRRMLQSLANTFNIEIDSNSALAHTIDSVIKFTRETNKVRDNVKDNPKKKEPQESEESSQLSFFEGAKKEMDDGYSQMKAYPTSATPPIEVSDTVDKKLKKIFKENNFSDIGSFEEYKRYLNLIFPESVVKKPVYHGSPSKNIEQFSKEFLGTGQGEKLFGEGFYFTESPMTARYYSDIMLEREDQNIPLEELRKMSGKTYLAMLNIQNPVNWFETNKQNQLRRGNYGQHDSVKAHVETESSTAGRREIEDLKFQLSITKDFLEDNLDPETGKKMTDEARKEYQEIKKELERKVELYDHEFLYGENFYIVPNPQNILILGSETDKKLFKQSLSGNKNKDSLDQTIGEFRSTLTKRQKEIFDEYRNRFQTKC